MSTPDAKAPSKNFALRQARERREGKLIPKEVLVEVTHRCNLKCLHCGLGSCINENLTDELTFSEITGIFDQLFEAGVMTITITGGEPLCRPDIFEIMEHARKCGLFFGVKTNGTLITEEVASQLKKSGIIGIHVSLYGATPETHDGITGVPGSFEKTVCALEILHQNKIRVNIKTTIMKQNFHENKDIEALAERFGMRYHPDPLVFPQFGQPGSADDIRIDDEQLWQLVKQRNWVNVDDIKGYSDISRSLICSAGRTRCAVSPYGEVFPCALWRIPLGDLRRQSFQEVWHGDAVRKIRATKVEDFPVCTGCELVKYCTRCPGLVFMEDSGISGPSSENCRLARAIKGVKDGTKQETLH